MTTYIYSCYSLGIMKSPHYNSHILRTFSYFYLYILSLPYNNVNSYHITMFYIRMYWIQEAILIQF